MAAAGAAPLSAILGALMTRAEKAERIAAILGELYPAPPIPLRHGDPFTLLIAVLLSAQCTDERVNQVTPALFAEAPTPEAMAALSEERILELIRSCGLAPAKARNIAALSRILVEQHGGRVPDTFEALEALPGVGHKTASVVVAQAFGKPAFPVDTHIHRLATRWGLTDGRSVEQTERDLKALFAREDWNWLHLAIIYFGREHCPARGHDLSSCLICSFAASKKRMREEAAAGGGGPRSRKASARATPARKRASKVGTSKRAATKKRAASKRRAATKKRAATKERTARKKPTPERDRRKGAARPRRARPAPGRAPTGA
jgi:endonuclease-3